MSWPLPGKEANEVGLEDEDNPNSNVNRQISIFLIDTAHNQETCRIRALPCVEAPKIARHQR